MPPDPRSQRTRRTRRHAPLLSEHGRHRARCGASGGSWCSSPCCGRARAHSCDGRTGARAVEVDVPPPEGEHLSAAEAGDEHQPHQRSPGQPFRPCARHDAARLLGRRWFWLWSRLLGLAGYLRRIAADPLPSNSRGESAADDAVNLQDRGRCARACTRGVGTRLPCSPFRRSHGADNRPLAGGPQSW